MACSPELPSGLLGWCLSVPLLGSLLGSQLGSQLAMDPPRKRPSEM